MTLVPATPELGAKWESDLSGHTNAKISIKSPNHALDDASGDGAVDAFVIDAGIARPGGGLALLSDLRSRAGARHAAILYAHNEEDSDSAATALDLGASDLIALSADTSEMAIRLRTQLRRKREGDALRRTVEDGLVLQPPIL